jgi:hypothetical protein
MSPELIGLRGAYVGQRFSLTPETTFGREVGNTIVCADDSSVSRRHARLELRADGAFLEDLGSSNGTFLNGVRMSTPSPVMNGDEIVVGSQAFRFDVAIPQASMPPRPKEVSRGEQAAAMHPRPPERPSMPDLSGCAMPRLDLPDPSGCLRFLMLMLLALVALLILGGLIMLIGAGIGMLSGGATAGGAGVSGGSGGSSSSSGGSSPPPQADPGQQPDNKIGIRVISAQIAPVWDSQSRTSTTRVLVIWENGTPGPVVRVWGNVRLLDAEGKEVGRTDNIQIYNGVGVPSGQQHEDKPNGQDGVPPPPATGPPVKVEVDATRYE